MKIMKKFILAIPKIFQLHYAKSISNLNSGFSVNWSMGLCETDVYILLARLSLHCYRRLSLHCYRRLSLHCCHELYINPKCDANKFQSMTVVSETGEEFITLHLE